MTRPRYIDDAEVERVFTLDLALDSQRQAFGALGRGEAVLAPRLLADGADDAVAFCYLARLRPETGAVTKLGSVNPANAERDEAVISATVHVLDGETGRPSATLEATALTTIRTAAASALAVDELARRDVTTLGVIGTGVQAKAHILALSRVREFTEVRLAGRSLQRAKQLAKEIERESGIRVRVVHAEAAAAANVVATCTTSFEAVLETSWVRPGATVVSVGAFAPDRRELPTSLLDRAALVVVDHRETAREQAGTVVAGLEESVLTDGELVELGTVVVGEHPGRGDDGDIVVYFSVGLGVQDAAAAEAVLNAVAAD